MLQARRVAREVLLALMVAAAVIPLPARAQGDDAATTALARELFREGLAAGEAERWDEAVERYRRVLALRDSPQVTFNLAQALVESGHAVEATELLAGLERREDVPIAVQEAATVLHRRATASLAHLTVEVPGAAPGDALRLDDRELSPAMVGVAMPVDPGAHRLVVLRAGDVVAESETVEVSSGQAVRLRIDVPPPAVEAPAVVPEQGNAAPAAALTGRSDDGADNRGPWRSPWLWGGVAAVVLGGVATALILRSGSSAATIDGTFSPGQLEVGP